MAAQAGGAPPVSFDFNNDGSSDFPVSIIGYDIASPASGAARIWSGASKAIIHTVLPADANTLFGSSVGSAGDLNADGFDDLVVGEPLWGPNDTLEGHVHVYSGANASELLTIPGFYPETALGRSVTGIGDWDGDGVPDIAASGWDIADTNNDGIGDDPLGIVFVFSGADGSELASIIEPTATQAFGLGLFGLGDVTGDGKADLAIVDRAMEGDAGASGRVFIFAGRAAPALLSGADGHPQGVLSTRENRVPKRWSFRYLCPTLRTRSRGVVRVGAICVGRVGFTRRLLFAMGSADRRGSVW